MRRAGPPWRLPSAATTAPNTRGDEEIAEAHHRGAEQLALELRQAEPRRGGVERVVGRLELLGDHQHGVADRHQHDPHLQPGQARHLRQQHAERDAGER